MTPFQLLLRSHSHRVALLEGVVAGAAIGAPMGLALGVLLVTLFHP